MVIIIKINQLIFREYDIRGIVGKDIDEEVAYIVGRGFASYLIKRGSKEVIVGYDTRETSIPYKEAFIKGLVDSGCIAIDVGYALSSMIYFARKYYDIDGACIITASHNPPEYNGFKLCHGLNAITGEEIQKIKEIILKENFVSGEGKIIRACDGEIFEKNGKIVNPQEDYFKELKKRTKLEKRLKVVVDCGNATPSLFIPRFLEELGCDVIPLFCNLDPRFPNHIPDPAHIENYKHLVDMVLKERADLGMLFDGDGDRVGFVDSEGNILLGDVILTILIREMLPKHKGAKVIVELKDSEIVVEETKRLGGIPIFWKTGHALLDKKVFEEKALLCGEMSCHYWITDNWYYFDDAIYAMCKVLEIASKKSLNEIYKELPRYENTPEYRIHCEEERKFNVVKNLVEKLKPKCKEAITLDGIRGYIYDGWFLIRASNTQPVVSLRCEAKSKDGLEKIKRFLGPYLIEEGLQIPWK